jgi:hypothetical protein
VYRIFVGNPKGNRPHEKRNHRQEDNIKIDTVETVLKVVDWIRLTLNRDWWCFCENVNEPFGSINFLTS